MDTRTKIQAASRSNVRHEQSNRVYLPRLFATLSCTIFRIEVTVARQQALFDSARETQHLGQLLGQTMALAFESPANALRCYLAQCDTQRFSIYCKRAAAIYTDQQPLSYLQKRMLHELNANPTAYCRTKSA